MTPAGGLSEARLPARVRLLAGPRVLLAGELALAGLLGAIALGRRSFWLDESVSVTIAKLPWSAFTHIVGTREGNMTLYHLLLSGWISLFGDSEVAARSLSVVAGVGTVAALYALARRLAGPRVALLAGLLLAVDPLFVHYAQEARGYELSVLLVTVATALFARALARQTWTAWLGYAAVAALGVYAHFFAVLVPAAHALSLVFVPRDRLQPRKLAAAAGLLVLLLVPFLYLLASNDSSGVAWAAGNALGRLFTKIHAHPPLAAALLVGGSALAVLGFLYLRRRLGEAARSETSWRWSLVLGWLIVPPAVVVVVAILFRPLFVVRYFTICVPAALLLVALLVARLRVRALAGAAAALIVAGSLAADVRWYETGQTEDWRHATSYVVGHTRGGDSVMFYPAYVRIPFALYLEEQGSTFRAPAPVYPAAGFGGNEIRYDLYVPMRPTLVRDGAARFRRVWLVLSHVSLFGAPDPGYRSVRRGLAEAGFAPTSRRAVDGVVVVRYDRSAPGA